ncbi:MAG: hypothetical protein H7070_16460 [Saprospiraceae bacterium]|nr:hypothetical protein [Pyrinomonadaceae bacterium]
MELSDKAKNAARELGDAVNSAIGSSRDVTEAIDHLREIGYEPHLTLRLEIALAKSGEKSSVEDFELDLSEDDVRTLQRMKIRFE